MEPHVSLPGSTHTLPAGSMIQHKTSPNQWIEVTLGVADHVHGGQEEAGGPGGALADAGP